MSKRVEVHKKDEMHRILTGNGRNLYFLTEKKENAHSLANGCRIEKRRAAFCRAAPGKTEDYRSRFAFKRSPQSICEISPRVICRVGVSIVSPEAQRPEAAQKATDAFAQEATPEASL